MAMYIVVAPQSLKGSLDAPGVGEAIAAGIRRVWPDADIRVVPVADGGEGTVRALVAATGGALRRAQVIGPLGEMVMAEYGILGGEQAHTAVIEMAAASGLPLVPPDKRDPRRTTTRGTGELMRAALDAGAKRLLIGIGGSATNDGGAGMAQALGARLLDDQGNELTTGGAALAHLARIDVAGFDPRLKDVEVEVACDVTNPLCGPEGASSVYGPQKGATPAMVATLDAALAHYGEVLRRDLGADVMNVPGAGAAGGLGAGLLAFAHARLVPGAQMVLKTLDFENAIKDAALVFTAEGQLDQQTAYGKAVGAVASVARRAGARVVALAGGITSDDAALAALGIDVALSICSGPMSLEESMAHTPRLLADAAARAVRLIALGRTMPQG
ncbi:MAG TPA: glycerate kinase [Ktedonobacterales bacterium]|nr:glycerate kinase [Ktedonobacterales bacterium]